MSRKKNVKLLELWLKKQKYGVKKNLRGKSK